MFFFELAPDSIVEEEIEAIKIEEAAQPPPGTAFRMSFEVTVCNCCHFLTFVIYVCLYAM